ncbi:MAG: hypothetical protein J2P46_06790 [Zavarzinella sp.]|nr:hypothetical protein [Zavarzinella sp.]
MSLLTVIARMEAQPDPRYDFHLVGNPARALPEFGRMASEFQSTLACLYALRAAADRFLRGREKRKFLAEIGARHSGGFWTKVKPFHAFLGEFSAFVTFTLNDHFPSWEGRWVRGLIAASRSSTLLFGGRRFATAGDAVEDLSFQVHDLGSRFATEDLFEAVDILLLRGLFGPSRDPSFDFRSGCHSPGSPPRDYDSLCLACMSGFAQVELPRDVSIEDRFRRVARALRKNVGTHNAVNKVRARPLATWLRGLYTERALVDLGTELDHELAAARYRIPSALQDARKVRDLVPRPSGPGDAARPSSSRRDARGRFAYALVRNRSLSLKSGLARFNAMAAECGWERVGTVQGLKHLAAVYASRTGRPGPVGRRAG